MRRQDRWYWSDAGHGQADTPITNLIAVNQLLFSPYPSIFSYLLVPRPFWSLPFGSFLKHPLKTLVQCWDALSHASHKASMLCVISSVSEVAYIAMPAVSPGGCHLQARGADSWSLTSQSSAVAPLITSLTELFEFIHQLFCFCASVCVWSPNLSNVTEAQWQHAEPLQRISG